MKNDLKPIAKLLHERDLRMVALGRDEAFAEVRALAANPQPKQPAAKPKKRKASGWPPKGTKAHHDRVNALRKGRGLPTVPWKGGK